MNFVGLAIRPSFQGRNELIADYIKPLLSSPLPATALHEHASAQIKLAQAALFNTHSLASIIDTLLEISRQRYICVCFDMVQKD